MDKRGFLKVLSSALVAAPVAAATSLALKPPGTEPVPSSGTVAYQRVMKRGVLRAGSFIEPPFTFFDAATNTRKGLTVALAESLTSSVNLRLEWVDVNFATLVDDLEHARCDAVCASLFMMPRAGRLDYTMPYAYVPVHGYVRANDKRFGADLAALDDPAYRIVGLEGEGATAIAHRRFPRAAFLDLPQGTLIPDLLLNVVNHKADVAFLIPTVFAAFEESHPGLLKPLPSEEPLHVFAIAFALKPGEEMLKSLLNNNLQRMIVSGELESLFATFDPNRYVLRPGIRYTRGC